MTGTTFFLPTYPTIPHMQRFYATALRSHAIAVAVEDGAKQRIPALVLNAIRELFNNGVGENFPGNALNLGASIGGSKAIGEGEGEILALADGFHLCETDLAQGVVNRLPLRIQNRGLQRNVDMSLHHP